MNIIDIQSRKFSEKVALLKQFGSHLTTRTTANYYVKLYSLGGHYVEVWTSSHLPWEGIVKVEVLSDTAQVHAYLSKEVFASMTIL